MKRYKQILLVLMALALLITGCAQNNDNADQGTEPVGQADDQSEFKTVVDVLGREVEVKNEINSMVVTPVPYGSIIYAIDGTMEKIVAVNPDVKSEYEKSLLSTLAPEFADVSVDYVSTDFTVNVEALLNLKPDVVVLWHVQENDIRKLEQVNIPAVALDQGGGSNLEKTRDNIEIIGKLLNKEQQAENLNQYNIDVEDYFTAKQDQIAENEKPKVLYIRDKNLAVAAGGSFNRQLIELTGGINVAAGVKGSWTGVSMEEVLNWNPEIIYLSNFDSFQPEDLYNNTIEGHDWSQIDAVKNKRVYKTPVGIIRWDAPCAETPLFMKWLGQIQQPELFNDYVLDEDIRNFYKEFLSYDLTEQELNKMLNR